MSNPNPYSQPGQNFGGPSQPNQPNQAFPAQQPNQMQQPQQPQQFGPQNQFNPQGSKGQSLQWNQMGAIAVGVSALLVLIFSFFPWIGFTFRYFDEKSTLRINGWGHAAESGPEFEDDLGNFDFGNVDLGGLFMILVLGLLIGAAVMLWLKAQSRIAVFMTIGSGALLLIWAIVTFVQFNGSIKKVQSVYDFYLQEEEEIGMSWVSLDGGPKFGMLAAILLALAIIAFGVFVIVKYGQQLNATGSNVSNQFSQPQGQPQTQPGNQFGQPQGQPQTQPGNQNSFGQPDNQNP